MVNYQVQFAKNRHVLPITRDYMLEGERAMRSPMVAPAALVA
jgi:cyclopropane-fatty-acyl-phospholipid synthase